MSNSFRWAFRINGKKLAVVFTHNGIRKKASVVSDDDKELAKRLTDTIKQDTEVGYGLPRITSKTLFTYIHRLLEANNATDIQVIGLEYKTSLQRANGEPIYDS